MLLNVKSSREIQKLVSFVQKIADIDRADIEEFASKALIRTFKKKELFVKEGEICKQLLFIHRGVFRYFVLHEGNDFTKDFAIDTQNPFCTSFTSFMTHQPSQIWIEALEDCDVWVWNAEDVLPLFEKQHAWTLFAKRIVETLYFRKEKRELSFLKQSPQDNYKQFLADFPQLHQRVPQYLIASYLGVTPESLSRIRKRLSERSK